MHGYVKQKKKVSKTTVAVFSKKIHKIATTYWNICLICDCASKRVY